MKPILIALMVVVGVGAARGQDKQWYFQDSLSLTSHLTFPSNSGKFFRLVYAGDSLRYEGTLSTDSAAREMLGKLIELYSERIQELKSRAQKKAELQEASKRVADFDQILREAVGRQKHDCFSELVQMWKEYERECEPRESSYQELDTLIASRDMYVKFPGISRLYVKKGERLVYPKTIEYSTTAARTPTFEGFILWLKEKSK